MCFFLKMFWHKKVWAFGTCIFLVGGREKKILCGPPPLFVKNFLARPKSLSLAFISQAKGKCCMDKCHRNSCLVALNLSLKPVYHIIVLQYPPSE